MTSPIGPRAFAAAASVLVLIAVTGCGAASSSHPSAAESTRTKTSNVATPDAWVALRDSETGVEFSLPRRVSAQVRTQPADGSRVVEARMYQVEIDGIGLSVGIVQPEVLIDPRTALDNLVAVLTQAGASDVKLGKIEKADAPTGGSALDGTVTFTAANGQKNYWRIRTIVAGRLTIQVQAISFSKAGDTRAMGSTDRLFERLAQSVVAD